MNRIKEKECQQYCNYGEIKYFFHHSHIYERQEAAYEQISKSGTKEGVSIF